MAKISLIYIVLSLLFSISQICKAEGDESTDSLFSPYLSMHPVKIGDVKWTNGFWFDKFELVRNNTIPFMKMIYMNKAFENFKITAGIEEGEFWGKFWQDGDFYKWLEAISYVYGQTGDAKLKKQLDEIIPVIGSAQEENGYISTANQLGHGITIGPFTGEREFKNKKSWQDASDHEVYNIGHLITAACVHYHATHETNFLDIAKKAADHLYDVFGNPSSELSLLIFNPSQIMALVDLYRITRESKYLELATIFIDMYGSSGKGSDQNQNRIPFRKSNEAVGHAVLGTYLFCGVADVYSETGEAELFDTLVRLWEDVVNKKMYITGGIGSIHKGISSAGDEVHEAFGDAYQLPNSTAYNETCANIANGMWNWRMLGITGDPKYCDVMEKVFYNSGISGLGIHGISFFYTNVLKWEGQHHHLLLNDAMQRWNLPRAGICCPASITRTIVEMSSYAYGISQDAVWVNLFGSSKLDTQFPDGSKLKLTQETEYPWEGKIQITIEQSPDKDFGVKLRIPAWADESEISINGEHYNFDNEEGKYVNIIRKWAPGDVISLNLPMKTKLVSANPLVHNLEGKVAVQRGPVVYCLESYDLPENTSISDIRIPLDISLIPRFNESSLGGVAVLEGEVVIIKDSFSGTETLYSDSIPEKVGKIRTTFIPYFCWNNRFDTESTGGSPEMSVWFPVIY